MVSSGGYEGREWSREQGRGEKTRGQCLRPRSDGQRKPLIVPQTSTSETSRSTLLSHAWPSSLPPPPIVFLHRSGMPPSASAPSPLSRPLARSPVRGFPSRAHRSDRSSPCTLEPQRAPTVLSSPRSTNLLPSAYSDRIWAPPPPHQPRSHVITLIPVPIGFSFEKSDRLLGVAVGLVVYPFQYAIQN